MEGPAGRGRPLPPGSSTTQGWRRASSWSSRAGPGPAYPRTIGPVEVVHAEGVGDDTIVEEVRQAGAGGTGSRGPPTADFLAGGAARCQRAPARLAAHSCRGVSLTGDGGVAGAAFEIRPRGLLGAAPAGAAGRARQSSAYGLRTTPTKSSISGLSSSTRQARPIWVGAGVGDRSIDQVAAVGRGRPTAE